MTDKSFSFPGGIREASEFSLLPFDFRDPSPQLEATALLNVSSL